MYKSIKQDKKRRFLFKQFESDRLQSKALLFSNSSQDLYSNGKSKSLNDYCNLINSFTANKKDLTSPLSEENRLCIDLQEASKDTRRNSKPIQFPTLVEMKKRNETKFRSLCSPFKRKGSLVRIRNRCILSARSGGVLRFSKLSRIRVRELASQGLLAGVNKASW